MFKYNGKIWNPKNPEKKLKQLGITWNDVEIIKEPVEEKIEEYEDPHRLHYFYNPATKYSISSIYNECKEEGFTPISLESLQELYDK